MYYTCNALIQSMTPTLKQGWLVLTRIITGVITEVITLIHHIQELTNEVL
jgi:hypothetical protein